MANWRRITGAAGLVVGATAAGAGAVIAAERIAVSRLRGRPGLAAPHPDRAQDRISAQDRLRHNTAT